MPFLPLALASATCAQLGGCGDSIIARDEPPSLAATILDAEPEQTTFESAPNGSFESPQPVQLTAAPQRLRGRIAAPDDVDLYDLGPVAPGDRILVEAEFDGGFRGTLALFDADRACLLINDDRNTYLGRREPFIDVTIAEPAAACYLAVAANRAMTEGGGYTLRVARTADAPPPLPTPDVVILEFDGEAEVVIGNRPPVRVPRFDAASLSPTYAGMTDELIRLVVDKVRADFAAFDVAILSTHEGAVAGPEDTRVHFGAYDDGLLGVADGVDEFNATRGQEAIIFTDSFAAMIPLSPTVEQLAQALANIAGHEIGHLLGLVHTRDPRGLMDVSASLAQLLDDQRFTASPLASDVFPVGFQDAPRLLVQSVGGDIDLARADDDLFRRTARTQTPPMTNEHPTIQSATTPLSTCALGEYNR